MSFIGMKISIFDSTTDLSVNVQDGLQDGDLHTDLVGEGNLLQKTRKIRDFSVVSSP